MSTLVAAVTEVETALGELVARSFETDEQMRLGDDELLALTAIAARIVRHGEALIIEGAAQVQQRSESSARDERLTARKGARSVSELLQRTTLASKQTVAGYERAAAGVGRSDAPMSGGVVSADYPALRGALAEGAIGADGIVAVLGALMSVGPAVDRAALQAADEELAASARGEGVDAAPSACAEELRTLAQVWSVYLDQDGAEPRESIAMRRRGFTIGQGSDGLVPVRGRLLPEVAAQLQRIFDSMLTPKPTGPRFFDSGEQVDPDLRSRPQQQHDVLANALDVAARSGELPTIGGAAPTLIVAVREEDMASGRGYAHAEGSDQPVSISVARHVACAGAVQRVVLNEGGRIVSISTLDRVFNHYQRKSIVLRDGGCLIPGCCVPASWCEIHHVDEASRGGPTHTDNGVLLCWFHHRTLESSGWQVRLSHGVPEVRGPYWWDPHVAWRPATKSHVRMRERLARRQ